jgi:hypothetical protein
VLPALLLCVVVAAHALSAGWALWSAGTAARAGARTELVGGDARAAARRALPASLRRGSRVRLGERTGVSVPVAPFLPGADLGRLGTSARLDAAP